MARSYRKLGPFPQWVLHHGPCRSGPWPRKRRVLNTTPVGHQQLDARVPGFVAVPKPSPRRAMLDPRRAFASGCRDAENDPRGSGFVRRPRSRIRRCVSRGDASCPCAHLPRKGEARFAPRVQPRSLPSPMRLRRPGHRIRRNGLRCMASDRCTTTGRGRGSMPSYRALECSRHDSRMQLSEVIGVECDDMSVQASIMQSCVCPRGGRQCHRHRGPRAGRASGARDTHCPALPGGPL